MTEDLKKRNRRVRQTAQKHINTACSSEISEGFFPALVRVSTCYSELQWWREEKHHHCQNKISITVKLQLYFFNFKTFKRGCGVGDEGVRLQREAPEHTTEGPQIVVIKVSGGPVQHVQYVKTLSAVGPSINRCVYLSKPCPIERTTQNLQSKCCVDSTAQSGVEEVRGPVQLYRTTQLIRVLYVWSSVPAQSVPDATSKGPCAFLSSFTPSRNSRPPAFSRALPETQSSSWAPGWSSRWSSEWKRLSTHEHMVLTHSIFEVHLCICWVNDPLHLDCSDFADFTLC